MAYVECEECGKSSDKVVCYNCYRKLIEKTGRLEKEIEELENEN